METTIKVNQTKTLLGVKQATASNLWKNAEFNRFGIIAILVLVIGCAGGIAAAFGAQADALKIGLVAFPSIITLALILAVAPMRAIFFASAIAFILDIVILAF